MVFQSGRPFLANGHGRLMLVPWSLLATQSCTAVNWSPQTFDQQHGGYSDMLLCSVFCCHTQRFVLFCTVLCWNILCCALLYVALYNTVQYSCILWCFAVWYILMLLCKNLFFSLQLCAALFCFVLNYILLCCFLEFCALFCSVMPSVEDCHKTKKILSNLYHQFVCLFRHADSI